MQFDEIEQDENVNSQNITMKDPTEVSWFHPVKVSHYPHYSQFATILDCILYVFDKYLSNITNFVNVLVFLGLILPYSSLASEDYPSPS